MSKRVILFVKALDLCIFRVATITFALFLFCFICLFLLLFSGPGVGQKGWLWFLFMLILSGDVPIFPFICKQVGWGFADEVELHTSDYSWSNPIRVNNFYSELTLIGTILAWFSRGNFVYLPLF